MNERERQLPPLGVVLRRVLPVALSVGILCAVIAYLVSAQREDQYSTSSLILLRPVAADPAVPAGDEASFTEGEGLATNALLVSRPGVLGRVAKRPEIELTPPQIAQTLEVEGVEGTNIIEVTTTTGDPVEAAQIATAVAEEFVEIRRVAAGTRVRQVLGLLRDQLADLGEDEDEGEGSAGARALIREQIAQLAVREEAPGQQPLVAQEARVPAAPVSPQPRRDAALAGLLGLVVGAGLGLLRVGTDRRLDGADEMRDALAAPVLVTVPSWRTLRRGRRHGRLPQTGAQGFRLLHLSLRERNGHSPVRAVAVTGADPDADAAAIAWHLAAAASAARDRVLLVEGGLSVDGEDLAERVLPASVDGGQGSAAFDILPSTQADGEDDPGHPVAFGEVLDEARDTYDVVVVPTSSMLDDPDAALVVEHADGVVVAASRGGLERERVDALRSQLELLGRPVVAVVVDSE